MFMNYHVKTKGGGGLGIYFGWSSSGEMVKICKIGSRSMGTFPS